MDTPERINYILVPWNNILKAFITISSFAAILYFISFHVILAAIIAPVYVRVGHMYFLFWKYVKNYGFNKIPVIFMIAFINVISFIFAAFLRTFILKALGIYI